MSTEALIQAIQVWQACEWVHPLTCGNDSKHSLLVPEAVENTVILKCPDCDWQQLITGTRLEHIVTNLKLDDCCASAMAEYDYKAWPSDGPTLLRCSKNHMWEYNYKLNQWIKL